MAKRALGFSSTVFRKKFRSGMTVRNYRDNEVIFAQGDTAESEPSNPRGDGWYHPRKGK